MPRFHKVILRPYSSLAGSKSPPATSSSRTTTTATSADANGFSPSWSGPQPTFTSKVSNALTPEAHHLALKRCFENLKDVAPEEKNWHSFRSIKAVSENLEWSGVVPGKSNNKCRVAWAQSLSWNMRKALYDRNNKSK